MTNTRDQTVIGLIKLLNPMARHQMIAKLSEKLAAEFDLLECWGVRKHPPAILPGYDLAFIVRIEPGELSRLYEAVRSVRGINLPIDLLVTDDPPPEPGRRRGDQLIIG